MKKSFPGRAPGIAAGGGFFLTIFPPSQCWRGLPWSERILRSRGAPSAAVLWRPAEADVPL